MAHTTTTEVRVRSDGLGEVRGRQREWEGNRCVDSTYLRVRVDGIASVMLSTWCAAVETRVLAGLRLEDITRNVT